MKKSLLCALVLLGCLAPARAQKAEINYNTHYRFPISFALEYGNLFPFQAYPEPYLIYEIAANLRWPIPVFPLLQPSLRVGMTQFVSNDPSGAKTWDHSRLSADAGVVLAHRFSKLIEVGLGVFGGYSHALFPNLYLAQGTVASPTLSFGGQGLVSLDPFRNLSISLEPSLRYLCSLSSLKRYDGLLWGIGASVHLRLGSDPDSAETKITNIDKQPIRDIEVSFYQSGYMDSPTPGASIRELGPAESRAVKFPAAFNAAVFETEGITPLTGEIVVSYFSS